MKTTKVLQIIFLFLAGAFLAYAFWDREYKIMAAVIVFWVLLWWFSLGSGYDYAPSVFFAVYSGLCLVGSYLGLRPIFLLAGIISALSAWDVDRFLRRWRDAGVGLDTKPIEKKHLLRLLAVDGIGFLLAGIGLNFRIQLSFAMMLLIGVLAIVSLSWLLGILRNSGSKN
jgi:hypothetical protein